MLCKTMYDVMRHTRNFFPVVSAAIEGHWAITKGALDLPFVLPGQYFLIEGSVLNDGVHKAAATDLADEIFSGRITPLAVPAAFIDLVERIDTYRTENATASPYVSESFGGYSYSKATNAKGKVAGWKDVFASELKGWKKL